MRILALDPGTHVVGWASVEWSGHWPPKLLKSGIINAGGASRPARLASIDHKLRAIAKKMKPDEIAVEGGYVGFGPNRNPPAQLALAEARGVIMVAAGGGNKTLEVYSPSEVKVAATGNGQAQKDAVMMYVQQIYKMPGLPMSDEADALAVALCHVRSLQAEDLRKRTR